MSLQIINTDLYPVDNLSSADAQSWIAGLRASLNRDGSCVVPNFVTVQALTEMTSQALSIAHLAYPGPTEVSPCFFSYRLGEGEDPPARHPLKRKVNVTWHRSQPT